MEISKESNRIIAAIMFLPNIPYVSNGNQKSVQLLPVRQGNERSVFNQLSITIPLSQALVLETYLLNTIQFNSIFY